MSSSSAIEWTDATWNPIVGCSLVSPGCTNCYAMTEAARQIRCARGAGRDTHYAGVVQESKAGPVWTGKLALAPDRILLAPLRRRKPTMYFVNSMGDLFHEDCPDEWIDRVFAVMALCPQHTFQVLTKRSARMLEYCNSPRSWARVWEAKALLIAKGHSNGGVESIWPLFNVWLGVSTEDQRRADERIPDLLATPAALRFISAEPLLGPIDLTDIPWPKHRPTFPQTDDISEGRSAIHIVQGIRLDWVIAGGESGNGARPMHPDWARSLRDQCAVANVPFFFKQWGEFIGEVAAGVEVDLIKLPKGDRVAANPSQPGTHLRFRRVGKARAGRLLDGALHNAMPLSPDSSRPSTPTTAGARDA